MKQKIVCLERLKLLQKNNFLGGFLMKQYVKPEFIVCSLTEDVMLESRQMNTYDDITSWGEGWSSNAGGNV